MNKIIILFILSFCFSQSYSQELDDKYEMAKSAYKAGNFYEADDLISEAKKLYKTTPAKVLFLEILIKAQILQADPFQDYELLEHTRKLVNRFEKGFSISKGSPFHPVAEVKQQLLQYPKDQVLFNTKKIQLEREEAERMERLAKADADAKARKLKQEAEARELKLKEEAEAKRKQEELEAQRERERQRAEKARLEQIEKDRIAKIERERQEEEQRRINKLLAEEAEKQRLIEERKQKRKLKSFTSLGFQSGEIAKYGLVFESGGKAIGFRMAARSSMTAEQDILNEIGLANKTEVEIGPNIKFAKWLYLNLGAGYGYYNANISNEYAGTRMVEKVGYVVTSAGIMIRLNRVININGGASFMDIDKDIYKPEITAGISFNLRKNRY